MIDPVGLSMMLRREIIRFVRKPNRTILPSIISTFLYIFAFGYALGFAIPKMEGYHIYTVHAARAGHDAGDPARLY